MPSAADSEAGRVLRAASLHLLSLLLTASSADAVERLAHRIEPQQGLPDGVVLAFAQDADGFIWVGTRGGLARYDGDEMRHVAAAQLPRADLLAASAGGEVLAGWGGGPLWHVAPGETRPVAGPDGTALRAVRKPIFLADGSLWLIENGALLRRGPGGGWSAVPDDALGGERPHVLAASPDGSVLAGTNHGVWRLRDPARAERLLEAAGLVAILPLGDDAFLASEFCCRVLEFQGGEVEERLEFRGRGIALARRGGTSWFLHDHGLVAIRPGGRTERIALSSATTMMPDVEGSLWVGTRNGVLRYPEPETVLWTIEDGLPNDTRYLARTGEGVLISATGGLGRIAATGDGSFDASIEADIVTASPLCRDREGRLWGGGWSGEPRRFTAFEVFGGRIAYHDLARPGRTVRNSACARGTDGGIWVAFGDRLFRPAPGGGRPVVASDLAVIPLEPLSMLVDSAGNIWLADALTLCRAPERDVAAGGAAPWRCEAIGAGGEIYDILEAAPGEIWAGTTFGGVLRVGEEGFSAALPPEIPQPAWVTGLAASREGGVWVMGSGYVVRVARGEAGWIAAERLSAWNGLPIQHGVDALEDEDGTLWITTAEGVLQIPREARGGLPAPPPLRLTGIAGTPAGAPEEEPFELPFRHRPIEARFAALSFREPGLIRYRVRNDPRAEWSRSHEGRFRYVDLAPGSYRIEVEATLDGIRWSKADRSIAIVVRPPWYLQGWSLALFGLGIAAIAFGVHRTVLAHRLELERQRVRIAMDLHDEMGSGLGSIGILAGVASQDGTDAAVLRSLSRRIEETADELGTSLADIVWSLRSESGTLEALAHKLAERGGRLFAGDRPAFHALFPQAWPEVKLSLPVRRNLQRIVTEAMHNAARHAGAGNVRMEVAREERGWRILVVDDGRGPAFLDSGEGAGMGMTSMRSRARAIGARITWSRTPGGGTTVSVDFDPSGRPRREAASHDRVRAAGARGPENE